MDVTQNEVLKIYEIATISITTNMFDIMEMVYNNKWFQILDSHISVKMFHDLIKLSLQTKEKYFEIILKNFPKMLQRCNKEYLEFFIKVQEKKRNKKCYYYDNVKYSMSYILRYLHDGCIVKHNNQLYIVHNNNWMILPINNDGYYIPNKITNKLDNPCKYFSNMLHLNIISNIYL